MRARLLPLTFAALTALHCARSPAAGGARVLVAPPASRARPARAPEADPEAFRVAAGTLDVDADGRDDRVRDLPDLGVGDRRGLLREAPPTVVAHHLPDGRVTVDDDVTRALLRAACPEAARATPAVLYDTPEGAVDAALVELFWTGFCVRAWGGTVDEAERAIRASALAAAPGDGAPELATEAVRAARQAMLPITLNTRPPETLRTWPTTQVPTGPAAPAALAVPPTDARCEAVVARNRQRVAAANRIGEARRRADPSNEGGALTLRLRDPSQCQASGRGIWSLSVAPARFLLEGDAHITADTTLQWTPTAGVAASLAPSFVSEQFFLSSTYPVLERAFDWDADGLPEVVLRVERHAFEGSEPDTVTLYTARGGAVRPYAPALTFEQILAVEDVDADGRPDLILPSPWRFSDHCGIMGVWREGPTLAAHALPDGTFSARDDVARAWVMRQCERTPRGGPGASPDVFDVACARAWGQSPEAVVAAARALALAARRHDPRSAEGAARCMSFHELAALAAVAPPFDAIEAGLTQLPDAIALH